MIHAQSRKLTFAEYLKHEDDTDNRYELIEGELVPLPPESPENDFIAQELFWLFAIARLAPRQLIRPHTCEIQVPILRGKDPANRYPDLVILSKPHLSLMKNRLTITLDMPPPQLVVEVVSPGKVNRENDYIHKRAQYAARGIPEYWIVDRQERVVVILNLNSESGQYIETKFRERNILNSLAFPNLELTAQQVLNVGES
ncbi:Uma2 family endonuclease [Lusitaniella coriacea]|uniref:Uma2 family endonuclease n=1 Tax=Lusitaniella coriacea TaxID=1983105 RepID=UPI003CF6F4FA